MCECRGLVKGDVISIMGVNAPEVVSLPKRYKVSSNVMSLPTRFKVSSKVMSPHQEGHVSASKGANPS